MRTRDIGLTPTALILVCVTSLCAHFATNAQQLPTPNEIPEMEVITAGEPVVFATSQCGGVKCAKPDSFRKSASKADVVFVGAVRSRRVIRVAADLSSGDTSTLQATEEFVVLDFEVFESLKGHKSTEIEVRTRWTGICGFEFEPDTPYLVYASRDDAGQLWTDPFKRTRPSGGAVAEIRKLKRRYESGE